MFSSIQKTIKNIFALKSVKKVGKFISKIFSEVSRLSSFIRSKR